MLIPHQVGGPTRLYPDQSSFSHPALQDTGQDGVTIEHLDHSFWCFSFILQYFEDIGEGLLVGVLLKWFGDSLERKLHKFEISDLDSLVKDRESPQKKQDRIRMIQYDKIRLTKPADRSRICFFEGGKVYGIQKGISFHKIVSVHLLFSCF